MLAARPGMLEVIHSVRAFSLCDPALGGLGMEFPGSQLSPLIRLVMNEMMNGGKGVDLEREGGRFRTVGREAATEPIISAICREGNQNRNRVSFHGDFRESVVNQCCETQRGEPRRLPLSSSGKAV